ncbi:hypothetical protein [Catenulispora pinisilvae]|uniref:hypothetical protein n=1 Tax=Catenulispora pinisilvae TaxID=2705253 RepID=UPI001890DBCB|nr:hypothetical protein [Catenulispora pinisilvae]
MRSPQVRHIEKPYNGDDEVKPVPAHSDAARAVLSGLDDLGLERLLALPAVPVPNARRMRYPVTVRTSVDDGKWYLRAFGTEFDLVDPSRRASTGGWYSFGWGLYNGREIAELLLVQVLRDDADLIGLRSAITGLLPAAPTDSTIASGRYRRELRLCAAIDPAPAGV